MKITEIYSHNFFAKISCKQRFYYYTKITKYIVDLTRYFFAYSNFFIFLQCGNFANSLPWCYFFREIICLKVEVLTIKKCYFSLFQCKLGYVFVSGKFELEVPLTETSKEINILFILFPQISSKSLSFLDHNIFLPSQT